MIIENIIAAIADCDIKPIALLPHDQLEAFHAEVPQHLGAVETDGAGNVSVHGVPVIMTGHVTELTMVVRYVEVRDIDLVLNKKVG